MKKFAVFILAALLIAGCANKKEDKPVDKKPGAAFDSSDIKTKPIDNPNQSFQMRYRFQKNQKYSYRLTTISEVTGSESVSPSESVTRKMKQQVIYKFDLTTKDIDSDSTSEISISITNIEMNAEADKQKITYKSGSKADSVVKKFAQYEALINNPFSVTVNKYGEVTDIFKVDKIINKLIEIGGEGKSIPPEQKNMIKQSVVDGGLRPLLVQLFRKVPEHNVAKDTTWETKQPANRYLTYEIKTSNKYKVSSLELLNTDKIAVLDGSVIVSAQGQPKVTEKGIKYEIKKPSISGEGKIYFNVTKGVIQKSKTRTRVEQGMTAEGPSPKGGTQKLTKKEIIENSNILELL
jgi:hypothetical protein